jgi:hypothetical protein
MGKLLGIPLFKDVKFEKLIRDIIKKPEGIITSEDMGGIGKIESSSPLHISDISGIEYCENLKILKLYNNAKSDDLKMSQLSSKPKFKDPAFERLIRKTLNKPTCENFVCGHGEN